MKAPKKAMIGVNSAIAVRYKTIVLNHDGSVHRERDWKRNLILDSGLNNLVALSICENWNAAVLGTGTTVLKRPGGPILFTKTGANIISDADFFSEDDVGALIKFDSGEEFYMEFWSGSAMQIDSFTTGDVSSTGAAVWYVNTTGLNLEVKRTSTKTTDSGDNGTTFSVDTYTHKRTFLFSQEAAPINYTEIGWSSSTTPFATLLGMDMIPGSGESLAAGQQLKVVVEMTVQISPVTQTSFPDRGSGYSSAGTLMLESSLNAVSGVDSNGGSTGGGQNTLAIEAGTNVACTGSFAHAIMADWTQQTVLQSGTVSLPSPSFGVFLSSLGYTPGTFFLESSATIGPTQAVGTIYGFNFTGNNGFGSSASRLNLSLKFDTPYVKDNLHSLSIKYRRSWQRILVN